MTDFKEKLKKYEQYLKDFGYEKVTYCKNCAFRTEDTYCSIHRIYAGDKYFCGSVRKIAEDEVNEAPTVEAIPVEWLKERYKIEGYYGTDEYFKKAYAVKEIIADWEAERRKVE